VEDRLFSRARIAYFLFGLGIAVTIALLSAGLLTRMDRLLQEPSPIAAIWQHRGRILLALGAAYVYTWPLYLTALLLYIYAPDGQKPVTGSWRRIILFSMIAALLFTPALAAMFYVSVVV
jgi:hypothetical protein